MLLMIGGDSHVICQFVDSPDCIAM